MNENKIKQKEESDSELISIADEFHENFLLLGLGAGSILSLFKENKILSLEEISHQFNEENIILDKILHEMKEKRWIELNQNSYKITTEGSEKLQHYKTIKTYFSNINQIPEELSKITDEKPVQLNTIRFLASFFKETFEHPRQRSIISNETGEVILRE